MYEGIFLPEKWDSHEEEVQMKYSVTFEGSLAQVEGYVCCVITSNYFVAFW
jgi:hypothetical protein